jgi:ribosomal protein S18 acetylase RimI-like enzyme
VRDIQVRPANDADFNAMWTIFESHAAEGETLVHDHGVAREEVFQEWFGPGAASWVAAKGERILGMIRLQANRDGRGAHVANACCMVSPTAQGIGIGHLLGEHGIGEARRLGFLAMQFNFVVSTNNRAIHLWKRLGFSIVGTLPKAFRHRRLGYVDAYVMYKLLEDPARWALPAED